MLYLNEEDMRRTGALEAKALPVIWDQVEAALITMEEGPSNAPLDAYLRSPDPEHFDRIIAKAGLAGPTSGVKWIASAPANLERGLPRASGLLILNDVVTGVAYAIMDAVPISNLRTAGVALVFLRSFRRDFRRAVIVGAGVHGREHCRQLLHGRDAGIFERLDEICVFDPFETSRQSFVEAFPGVTALDDPAAIFADDTALLYCTNALKPHIEAANVRGKRGLSVVHTSLRDFLPEALAAFDHCVADSVEHVARAKTSVDLAITAGLLEREACLSLPQLLIAARDGGDAPFAPEENVILNPMGLVANDLLVGEAVYQMARDGGLGTSLET
ncbi:MAG: hypothetical protein AAF560_13435 [Acidobacteriota bacterium]